MRICVTMPGLLSLYVQAAPKGLFGALRGEGSGRVQVWVLCQHSCPPAHPIWR